MTTPKSRHMGHEQIDKSKTRHTPTIAAAITTQPISVPGDTDIPYENNPLLITINGVKELFTKSQTIAITLIILTALGFLANLVQLAVGDIRGVREGRRSITTSQNNPTKTSPSEQPTPQMIADSAQQIAVKPTPTQWTIIGVMVLIVTAALTIGTLIGAYIKSVIDYTATHVSRGKTIKFADALMGGLHGFIPYLWIQIIVCLKIFLWSLLFIVPGFVMAVRYSLAGMSFYGTGKRGNAAIKHSLELTKGAWLTTYASYSALNMLTGGIASILLSTGSKIVLYRQLSDYRMVGRQKPSAHIISWLTLILPFAFVVLVLFVIALSFAVIFGLMRR